MKYRSWAPQMRFTVWRGKQYLDVSTMLRHRWPSSRIRNYDDRPGH
jgi:hypothetical protein